MDKWPFVLIPQNIRRVAFVVAFLSAALSGCSSGGGDVDAATLNQLWAGRQVEDAISKLGAPTQTKRDPQGNGQVMIWDRDTSYNYNRTTSGGQDVVGVIPSGPGGAVTPILQDTPSRTETRTASQRCRIQVAVNAQNKIVSFSLSNPDLVMNTATAGATGAMAGGVPSTWESVKVAVMAGGVLGGSQLLGETRQKTCSGVDLTPP
jgi:hypothetical protein